MRLRYFFAAVLLAIPAALGQGLPDLGEASQAGFGPMQERVVGEAIMRQIRSDAAYDDDPEVVDYLNMIGNRLATKGADTRQEFEFFVVRDNAINAFALPGGFIGVHTGLLLSSQSESELASVLSHEIAHVTQRHIARMLNQQKTATITSLAAMAVALLAARAGSDIGTAAAAFGQAGAIQSQLNFTREAEKEADRVGLQILDAAGYDPRGMAVFFGRLQRAVRFAEGNAPSYLRTHPLSGERMTDIQNRLESMPYRQVPDSLEFQLVRAKVRAASTPGREGLEFFQESLNERKFLSEAASRYGLTQVLVGMKQYLRAKTEMAAMRKLTGAHPMVDTLNCRILAAAQEASTDACYRTALAAHPNHRALTYDYAEELLRQKQAPAALKLVEARLQTTADDARLYQLQARSYAALGKQHAQHRAWAESYVRRGNLRGAIEQLMLALKAGDADFYQTSATEARLRQLRAQDEELRREQQQQTKR